MKHGSSTQVFTGVDRCVQRPEEEAESSSTGEGVGGAGADILSVHLRLTTVTLRTQHGATDQTQRGGARLVPTRPRTPAQVRDR